jgi:Flp pilus assembly protein protease CpaA
MHADVTTDLRSVSYALFALYLAVVGAWDLRTREVPNFLTLPGIALVLLWRAIRVGVLFTKGMPFSSELAFVPYWIGVWMLWLGRAIGGGDAKLLMVLFGVFPRTEFLAVLVAVTGMTMAAVLLWRYGRRRRIGLFLSGLLFRLSHGRFFPTEAELEVGGEPTAFLFSAAGMVMVVLSSLGTV